MEPKPWGFRQNGVLNLFSHVSDANLCHGWSFDPNISHLTCKGLLAGSQMSWSDAVDRIQCGGRSPVPRVRPARRHTPAAGTSALTPAWLSRRGGRLNDPHQTDTTSDGACSPFRMSPGTETTTTTTKRNLSVTDRSVHSLFYERWLFPSIVSAGILVSHLFFCGDSRICRLWNKTCGWTAPETGPECLCASTARTHTHIYMQCSVGVFSSTSWEI